MVQLMCKHAIMASNRKTKPILKNKTFYWTLSKVGIKIQSFKRTITCHLNIFLKDNWDHQVPCPYTTLE